MEHHARIGEFTVPDVHRAIDGLTILRIRLAHLERRLVGGEPVSLVALRELGVAADALTATLLHHRDRDRDATTAPIEHASVAVLPVNRHRSNDRYCATV